MSEGQLETVGQRLRRLRVERGFSQRELASPGVSYAYISRIEAGTRQPSVKALRKLARKLGVSAEYLETGSEMRQADLRELRLAEAELDVRLDADREGAERVLREVLAEAEADGDAAAASRARTALGLAAFQDGRTVDAIALLEPVAEREEPSPALRPDLYATLGRAYAMQGAPQRAVDLFERCLERIETETPGDVPSRIRFATYLSFALTDKGDLDGAEATLRAVLGDVDTFADPYSQVRIYWSLGRLAGHQGRAADALEHLRKAIALLEATEDTVHLARAHLECGWSLITNGRAEEAGTYLDAAERLFGPKPMNTDLAALRTEQARRAVALGEASEAVRCAREAIAAVGDAFVEEQATAWLALAQGLTMLAEHPAANEAYRRAVERYEAAGKPQDAANAYRAWGRALRGEGRESEALDAFEQAADLAVRPTEARAQP